MIDSVKGSRQVEENDWSDLNTIHHNKQIEEDKELEDKWDWMWEATTFKKILKMKFRLKFDRKNFVGQISYQLPCLKPLNHGPHLPLLDEAFLNALLEGEQRGKHDGRVVSLVQIRFFQRDDVVIVNVVYLAFRLHILTFYFFLLLTGFS